MPTNLPQKGVKTTKNSVFVTFTPICGKRPLKGSGKDPKDPKDQKDLEDLKAKEQNTSKTTRLR